MTREVVNRVAVSRGSEERVERLSIRLLRKGFGGILGYYFEKHPIRRRSYGTRTTTLTEIPVFCFRGTHRG